MGPMAVHIVEPGGGRLTRRQKVLRLCAVAGVLVGGLLLWEAGALYAQRPPVRFPIRTYAPDSTPVRPATETPMPIVERDIDVAGVRMHYAEGGTGTPIVLCHGWTLNHRIWFRNLEALAQVGHVYALDWPGFGLSAKPPDAPYDPAYQVQMLAGFLDALHLDRVHLIGHSMAGHWTTLFLLTHPDRVDRYVGVASAAMVPGPPAYRGRVVRFFTGRYYHRLAAREDKLAPQVAFWERNLRKSEPITAAFIAQVSNYDTRGDPASVPITMAALTGMLGTPLRTQVHRISTPALLIWGNRDTAVPLMYGKRLARSLPHAELLVLEGVGHAPFLQEPDIFNRTVAEFLSRGTETAAPGRDGDRSR